MGINCKDYSTLAVSSTAVGFEATASPQMPNTANGAVITVEDNEVRYRIDGTDPTATEGQLLGNGDVLTFDSWTTPRNSWRSVLKAIRFIRVTNDADMKIHFFD